MPYIVKKCLILSFRMSWTFYLNFQWKKNKSTNGAEAEMFEKY